ncbi:MAG: amidohydrolase, partial [Gemmatimonadetes bacterium]|nr:amidohydrolase [Gemmatimonadota bacterium]
RWDRQTGEFTPVTSRYGGAGNASLNPDGTLLAYVTREGLESRIVLRDLESGAERFLGGGLDRDQQEAFAWTGIYPAMDFTPDGKEIVYSGKGRLWRRSIEGGDPIEIPFTARVEQTLQEALRFKPDVLSENVRARTLRWIHESTEAGRIVFCALGRLYTCNRDGSNVRRLLNDDDDTTFEYAPRFSPDGKRLAYVTWNDEAKGHVWRSNANGRTPRQLTEVPGQYANPNWSSDGKRLVYLKGSGATLRGGDLTGELWHEIYILDADGGEPEYVTSVGVRGAQARMPNPIFGPDDARIYYFENADQKTIQYVSVRPDGTDKQTHVKIPYGEEAILSPDGKWLAYKHLHDGYLAPLPRVGQQTLDLGDKDGAVVVKKLSSDLADWLHWTDANTITWAAGPSFYRQTLDKLFAEPPEEEEDDEAEEDEEDEPDPNAPEEVDVVLEVPRHVPAGTLVIDGARLIPMAGDEVIEDGVMVIRGNRIVAAGRRGSVSIPDDVDHTVDARGLTAIPGLVDAHAHMGYGGLDINPQRDWKYYANLAYGVTTTMDPSASTHLVFAQSEMVEAGVMKGPRIYSTGFILYGADIAGKAPTESYEDALRHVQRLKKLGAFSVKSYMQPRREQRQWYIKAAREEEMLVFPEGGGNFEYYLGMIIDGHTGIEHSVPVAPLYDDVVQLWAATEVGYTPTLLVSYGGLSGEHW